MSEERIAALEANLLAVTDQVGRLMDQVLQKGFVAAFRCGHSGLLLPGNWVKDWGRDGIGIGLGPDPVSEVWNTNYEAPPPEVTSEIMSVDQIMHPVAVSCAQVDLVMVPPEQLKELGAVLARDDAQGRRRAAIVRRKQMENPRGRLRWLHAAFEQRGKVIV